MKVVEALTSLALAIYGGECDQRADENNDVGEWQRQREQVEFEHCDSRSVYCCVFAV